MVDEDGASAAPAAVADVSVGLTRSSSHAPPEAADILKDGRVDVVNMSSVSARPSGAVVDAVAPVDVSTRMPRSSMDATTNVSILEC